MANTPDPKIRTITIRVPKGMQIRVDFEYIEEGEVELQSSEWIKISGASIPGPLTPRDQLPAVCLP